jgi:SNF2 family DNA or RNA helicase
VINIIVCPTTITHNWNAEINKFFTGFKPVVYEGTSNEKKDIIKNIHKYDVLIISYEKLRNDIK